MIKTGWLLVGLIICVPGPACAQECDSLPVSTPELYPWWTLYVPGATHFHDGRIVEGFIFTTLEIGGIITGMAYDDKLRSNSTSPYYNYPLLAGLQAYNIDKCDFLRNRLEYISCHQPGFRYDPLTFNELLLEPFRPKNIFTPITGTFVLIALAELYLTGRNANYGFRDVEEMYFMNRYIKRNPAMAIFGAGSLAASYGAGVAEEYWFRNGLMPVLDYRYGKKKGLIYSSLFFGAMHFTNILFSGKPDYRAALIQVAEATVAGYFLGRSVQRRGYDIGPAVAAHTWYDFTLMLGSFLVNPEENVFGVEIKFTIR